MFRHAPALALTLAACATDAVETADVDQDVTATLAFHREHLTGDLYHYDLVVPIGTTPNAKLHVHRVVREVAPFVPRHTTHAAMMLHGDFSTFTTNFLPGLAPYLAARDIDVWGVDRRWTLATDDTSDLGTMSVAQELDDVRAALAIARAGRLRDHDPEVKPALIGFSHGAQLAYTYASVDAARPAREHTIGALVPLDFYGDFAPEDSDLHDATCQSATGEYQLVAAGTTDSPNDFFIAAGQLAASAPDDPSPLLDGYTNRGTMLLLLGQTYLFAPFAPFYHLLAPILDGDTATGLRETTEAAANAWIANATPHESMLEAADFDALLCARGPQPVDAPLSRIRVPLFYIGAGGGVGTLGLHATTQVASADVTTSVVALFGPERRAEDFGHADLLFGADAPTLAWKPLATWLAGH